MSWPRELGSWQSEVRRQARHSDTQAEGDAVGLAWCLGGHTGFSCLDTASFLGAQIFSEGRAFTRQGPPILWPASVNLVIHLVTSKITFTAAPRLGFNWTPSRAELSWGWRINSKLTEGVSVTANELWVTTTLSAVGWKKNAHSYLKSCWIHLPLPNYQRNRVGEAWEFIPALHVAKTGRWQV